AGILRGERENLCPLSSPRRETFHPPFITWKRNLSSSFRHLEERPFILLSSPEEKPFIFLSSFGRETFHPPFILLSSFWREPRSIKFFRRNQRRPLALIQGAPAFAGVTF